MKWVWQKGKRLEYLTIPDWLAQGVLVGFSARNGGESRGVYSSLNLGLHVNDDPAAVIKNRDVFLAEFDVNPENCVAANQNHGIKIKVVSEQDKGRGMKDLNMSLAPCDGLCTKENIGLMGFFSDCVPVYFFNPRIGLIGLAHAGWKGTADKICSQMLRQFELAGGLPGDCLVAIGPSIGQCCYEVGDDVAGCFGNGFSGSILHRVDRGKYKLDLKKANIALLISEGVRPENIIVSDLCNSCHPDLFYSHRRDGLTGRMAGFIRKRE